MHGRVRGRPVIQTLGRPCFKAGIEQTKQPPYVPHSLDEECSTDLWGRRSTSSLVEQGGASHRGQWMGQ
jgi:hypothetical protein